MGSQEKRLTIMVVPGTGSRTRTFHIPPVVFGIFLLTLLGIAGVIGSLLLQNRALARNQEELTELRKINRIQQAELDEMTAKARDTQEKLKALYDLQQQIQELQGDTSARSSRSATAGAPSGTRAGRGGPGASLGGADLPTLSAMLPPDVRAHLFSKRDTLAVYLRDPQNASRSASAAIAQSTETKNLMSEQLQAMDTLMVDLQKGKQAIQDQKEFLAHRPSGMPVSGAEVTDRFGWRWSPFGWGRQFHNGIDLAQDYWTPIVSTGAGVVVHAGWLAGGYGYTVIVDHGYGYETLYAHMIDWDVTEGQQVKRGDRMGWVGSTGNSTGSHVHYEVHLNGVPVDPTKHF